MITSLIPSFNSGELSPMVHLRSDLEKYRSGCRTLQNMVITPYGGVTRRPGLSFVGQAPGKARVFRFQAAIDQGYVIELSEGLLRFYYRDELVKTDADEVFTLPAPYAEEDMGGIQMAQINSVAYFVHPLYPVHRLVRFSHNSWTFAPVVWAYPAMLDENVDENKKVYCPQAEKNDVITVQADFNLFEVAHEGAYFQISQRRPSNGYEVKLSAVSSNNGVASAELIVQGAWSFATTGNWIGTFDVQRYVNGAWESIRQFQSWSSQPANYSASGAEKDLTRMRMVYWYGGTPANNPYAVLEASGTHIRGLIRIDTVLSATEARATVIKPVRAGWTEYWRESAWSPLRGYPRTVTAHEQRVVYAGNEYRPQTVWGSAIDDYEYFEPGVEDSDSYTHTLVSGQQNDIQWMLSGRALLIGTSGDEWVMTGGDEYETVTPTSVRARRHSGNGSDYLKARLIDENAIFVQRGSTRVREMRFSFEADGYVTQDLTLLASHIAQGKIIDTAWQTQPESILWCVTGDGKLLGLTYDRAQQVVGWHRHETGSDTDGFESVAIKATEGEKDQVWVVVRRLINGTVRRYVERLNPDGYFQESPWDLLYETLDGYASWKYYVNNYTSGSVVKVQNWRDSPNYIHCVALNTHTCDANTLTSSESGYATTGSTQFYTDNWRAYFDDTAVGNGANVVAGNWIYIAGVMYNCILTFVDGVTDPYAFPPDTGWETFWEVVQPPDGFSHPGYLASTPLFDWLVDQAYVVEDRVVQGGYVWECILGHTSSPTSEPGVGVDFETYWEIVRGSYAEGDKVSRNGVNYQCSQTHTPELATEPGVGAGWEDYWVEMTAAEAVLFYVDSGKTQYNADITEFTGLGHLEGETVQIIANGAALTPRVVSEGKVTLDLEEDPAGPYDYISAGLAYDSILQPMALETGLQNGTSVGREKRIHELVIMFKDSYGCQVSDRLDGTYDTLAFYDTGDGSSPTLFTGPYVHKLDSRHDFEASFVLKQSLPLPMTILAIIPKFNIYGDN